MSNPEKTVFISYRRSVSSFIARAIFQDLRALDYDVFMDVESINAGEFEQIILSQIAARAHFLVILTPGSVDNCVQKDGSINKEDWLRREIEYAIDLQRNIVPIIANNFDFRDAEKYLTGKLRKLPAYNSLPLYHEYFDACMERLRTRHLQKPVYADLIPPPLEQVELVEQKIEAIANEPAPTPTELTAEQYFTRAFARERADYDGKISDYSEAIRLNPRYAVAYNNRGIARIAKGDLKGAIADYRQAIRYNPDFAEAYYNWGNAYLEIGDIERASAGFKKYLELGGGQRHGNHRQVEAVIRELGEKKKVSDATDYYRRASRRARSGNLEGAIADLVMFLELGGGKHYHNQTKVEQMVQTLVKQVPANQALPAVSDYYQRASAYAQKGRPTEAVRALETYLRLGGGIHYGNEGKVKTIIQRLKERVQ